MSWVITILLLGQVGADQPQTTAAIELLPDHRPAAGAETLYTDGGIRWQVHWMDQHQRMHPYGGLFDQGSGRPAPVAMTIAEWVLMARTGDPAAKPAARRTADTAVAHADREELLERQRKRRYAAENCNRIARVYAREDTQLSAVDRKRLLAGLKSLAVDSDLVIRAYGRAGVAELAKRKE